MNTRERFDQFTDAKFSNYVYAPPGNKNMMTSAEFGNEFQGKAIPLNDRNSAYPWSQSRGLPHLNN